MDAAVFRTPGSPAARFARRELVGVLAVLSAAGASAAPAVAAAGIQVSINGAPSGFVPADEVQQNFDVEPQPGQLPTIGGGLLAESEAGEPGMSVKLLAELVGVAPAYTLQTMTVTGEAGPALPLDRTGVVFGFTDAPYESVPYYAVFGSTVANTGPYSDETTMIFGAPAFGPPGQYGTVYAPDGTVSYPGARSSPDNGTLQVDIVNLGTVLGVPQPAFDLCTPGVGQNVGFSLPSGGVVSLGQGSGAAADSRGLTYSWDFGDGTPPTALSALDAASHSFATTGTFHVRLTAVDSAGNAGVSPLAAQVAVGSAPGAAGPCARVPGAGSPSGGHGGPAGSPSQGGGTQKSGGGAGAANTLSSGAATGSVHAPTSSVSPRTSGAAAPAAATKPRGAPPTPSSSASGTSGSSGAGGGGTGSGGGRHGGSAAGAHGNAAGASGRAGAGGVQPRGSRSGAAAGGGRSKPPKIARPAGAVAAPGLTGVLIESLGSPLSASSQSASLNTLSLLQSVARRSTGGGGTGGLPAWLLGIVSLTALVVLGVVREAGVGLAGRLRAGRSGRGGISPGVA
jgi:hypothetical protein